MPWYSLIKVVHFMGLIALAGAFVIYPRVGARLRASNTLDDVRNWPVPANLASIIANPTPWTVMFAINIAAIAVIFEMTRKLGWIGALALVVGGVVLGAIIGAKSARPRSAPR